MLQYNFPSMGMKLKIDITIGNLAICELFNVYQIQKISLSCMEITLLYSLVHMQLYIQSTTDDDDNGH